MFRRPLLVLAAASLPVAFLALPSAPRGAALGDTAQLAGTDLAVPSASLAGAERTVTARVPGTTAAEMRQAAELVSRMSVTEVAGQVIVTGYRGTGSPADLVRRLHLGGTLPVAGNITSAAQISRVNQAVRRAVAARGYPAFVGVDQEGGRVARVGAPATAFPTFLATGAANRPDLTEAAATANAREMAELGFTAVMAPVADVTRGLSDPVIGSRSAGDRPAAVAAQVVAADSGMRAAGMIGSLKHFPGHGSLTSDSHVALPVQRKTRAQLMATDLVPFRRAIAAGANVVMTGHIDVRSIDPGVPASMSRKVTTGLLREQLGFEGLVVTDGLGMVGVSRRYPSAIVGARALAAGADVVLMPPDPAAARAGIVRAVREGSLSRNRLDEAATRMIALLLHEKPVLRGKPLGSGASAAARLSAAALTSVSGPCSGRLVGTTVRVSGPEGAVATFRRAAQAEGLRLARKGDRKADKVVLAVDSAARGRVVVALDRPNLLARSKAAVRLAAYGQGAGPMRAVVRHLLGRAPAPGKLPVKVGNLPAQAAERLLRTGC